MNDDILFGLVYSETIEMNKNNEKEKLDTEFSERIMKECMTDDPEVDHSNADEILRELLEKLGFSKVVEAYGEVHKRYA